MYLAISILLNDIRNSFVSNMLKYSSDFDVKDPDADWDDKTRLCPVEWSSSNGRALISIIEEAMSNRDNINILEIGVDRNAAASSTKCFISRLRSEDKYFGVDIADRSHIVTSENIRFLKINSSEYGTVVDEMTKFEIDEIDILFIDGWHSLNQILKDLEYVKNMRSDGVIVLHDVNGHPGPREIVRCIDREYWDVINHCPELSDYGLATLKMKREI